MKEENTKRVVIDASFVLAFLLPDEESEEATSILKQYKEGKIHFVASSILPFEVINGLKSAVKQKRITKSLACVLIEDFQRITIEYFKVSFDDVFKCALEKDLSVYDASYISLAQSRNIPLLTLDKALKQLV